MIARSGVCFPFLVGLIVTVAGAKDAPKPSEPDPIIAEALAAAQKRDLAPLAGSAEARLKPLLGNLDNLDVEQITGLATVRELARYFSRLNHLDGNAAGTLAWLIQQPKLSATLLAAVGPADAPDRVMAVLDALRADRKEQLEELPDLVAATCIVWDAPASGGDDAPADVQRAIALFGYYCNARGQLRFDPKQLPWQLATYLIDNQAGPEEVQWALQRYRGRGAIGAVYFDVPYDMAAFYGSGERQIKGREYTLQNLTRFGGICGDQAYFATQVARSVGVPATVCSGMGGMNSYGHAWVGYLQVQGRSASWNFSEGRYPEHMYWKGQVIEPQTRQETSDADVALSAELIIAAPRDRIGSEALTKLADLVEPARQPDIFMKAINLSPGNRLAWQRLAALGAVNKLSIPQRQALKDALVKFAVKRYPDFAFETLAQVNSARPTAQQIAALEELKPLFPNRPDLLAEIGLKKGDLLRADQRPGDALAAYGEVLSRYGFAGPIVLDTMQHIEQLLLETRDLARLAAIYKMAWQRMPQPETSAYVRQTPYYLLGTRYASLLEQMATNPGDLQNVRMRLEGLDQAAMERRRTGR